MSKTKIFLAIMGFVLSVATLSYCVANHVFNMRCATLDGYTPNYTEREQYYSEGYNDGIDAMEGECVRRGFAYFKQTGGEDGPVFTWKTKEEVCSGKKQ